jgi:hypothetical protein
MFLLATLACEHRSTTLPQQALTPAQTGGPIPKEDQAMFEVINILKNLKPGMTRADLEQYFRQDGGIQGPNPQRYVYRAYIGIKIDIEFDFDAGSNQSNPKTDYWSNPKDRIKTISKPYLQPMYMD